VTVLNLFGKDVSLGKTGVSWDDDVSYLEKRGFKVANLNAGGDFLAMIGDASKGKILQGLFFWGHGDPWAIYNGDGTWGVTYKQIISQLKYGMGFVMLNACFSDHKTGDTDIKYWFPNKPFEVQTYQGPVDFGGRNLLRDNPNAKFFGAAGILSPFQRIPILKFPLPGLLFTTAGHPSDILKPGDQGTKL
jgi:hypothetical protein